MCMTTNEKKEESFIMLPSVDFCFQELMEAEEGAEDLSVRFSGFHRKKLQRWNYFQRNCERSTRKRNTEF